MNTTRDFRPTIIEPELGRGDSGIRADPRQRIDPTSPRVPHPAIGYRPPRHLVVIRRSLIAGGIAVALTVSYVAYWFFTANAIRTGALDWAEAMRRQGYAIQYSHMEVGGFPLSFRIALSDLEVNTPLSDIVRHWKTKAATAVAPPWNPNRIHADLSGHHELGLMVGGTPTRFTGQAAKLALDLRPGQPLPASLALSGSGLRFSGDDGSGASARTLAVEMVRIPHSGTGRQAPAFSLAVSGDEIEVPESLDFTFGSRITRIGLETKVQGPLWNGLDARSLGAWRDDGGTIDIGRFSLTYGPLSLAASGTLALDQELQPIGTFTARFQGFFEVIDVLRGRGQILARDATTAKVVLGALAKRPEGGGPATLTVPLTIRERTLFAGPVKFLTFPPIPWEDAGLRP